VMALLDTRRVLALRKQTSLVRQPGGESLEVDHSRSDPAQVMRPRPLARRLVLAPGRSLEEYEVWFAQNRYTRGVSRQVIVC
jgi:hypothetical protein